MTRPTTLQQQVPANVVNDQTHQEEEEEIDEAGEESFPASDPPPWTLGVEPHGAR